MEKCTHRMSAERTVAQEWRTRRRTETGATFESRARKFPFPHIARERMLGLLEVQCDDKNQMGFAIFYYGVFRLARRLLGATEREMHRKRRNALMTANMINPLCACRSKSATAHSETNTNVRPNTVLR